MTTVDLSHYPKLGVSLHLEDGAPHVGESFGEGGEWRVELRRGSGRLHTWVEGNEGGAKSRFESVHAMLVLLEALNSRSVQ